MGDVDYSEIICTAIDEIVTTRLQGLAYDVTKTCNIVDDSQRQSGKYVVTDGSIRFEAYSIDTSLRKGNSVLVTIPNGDFDMQKTITGRVAADSAEPFNYTKPLDNMTIVTPNILESGEYEVAVNKASDGLLANDHNGSTITSDSEGPKPMYTISNARQIAAFSRLGITADFKAWFNGDEVVEGVYGLKMLIYTAVTTSAGYVAYNDVYELDLNSNDMIGNPYSFEDYFQQEKVFDISSIKNIKRIEIYFYQNGNFVNADGDKIEWILENDNPELQASRKPENLFVKNVNIYLGYEPNKYTTDTLIVYSENPLSYHYMDYPPHAPIAPRTEVKVNWLHKTNKNQFDFLTQEDINSGKYEIHWFKYSPGYEPRNKYAGANWEEIPGIEGESFTNGFIADLNKQQETIKCIGLVKQEKIELNEDSLNNDQDYLKRLAELDINDPDYDKKLKELKLAFLPPVEEVIHYTSNILTFANETWVPDGITYEALSALSIGFSDNSDGNYFVYDTNNKINNDGQGSSYQRHLTVKHYGVEVGYDSVDYVTWYLPYEDGKNSTRTMLAINSMYYLDSNYEIVKYRGIDYLAITKTGKDISQTFSIKNNWLKGNIHNTIRCVARIKGVQYETSVDLSFGRAGTSGTNMTLVLEFEDGKTALSTMTDPKNPDSLKIQALLYDVDGKKITKEIAGIWDWGWANNPFESIPKYFDIIPCKQNVTEVIIKDEDGNDIKNPLKDEEGVNYVSGDQEVDQTRVEIACLATKVPIDNYAVLRVRFTPTEATPMEAFISIPIKHSKYAYIEGAKDVVYNSQGTPSYYTGPYNLFYLVDGEYLKESNLRWRINSQETNNGRTKSSRAINNCIPSLKPIDNSIGNYLKVGKLTQAQFNSKVYYILVDDTYELAQKWDANTIYYELEYEQGLSANAFYAKGFDNRVCVYAQKDDGTICWVQPIAIYQNVYDSALLNGWNGKLSINEDNGTILSAVLGAGRKNIDNTFSGILMGDVKDLAADQSNRAFNKVGPIPEGEFTANTYYTLDNGVYNLATYWQKDKVYYIEVGMTGLYGFHDGEIAYSLRENGMATFGKAGHGQIVLNGEDSTITSGNFWKDKEGMKIDLDDGSLEIYKKQKQRVLIQSVEPYFEVHSADNDTLIHIGDTDYFLQSDDFTNKRGVKLDLSGGSMELQGSGGAVKLDSHLNSPFFKVEDSSGATLINMATDSYFLQSKDYSFSSTIQFTHNGVIYYVYTLAIKPNNYYTFRYLDTTHMYHVNKSGNTYSLGAELNDSDCLKLFNLYRWGMEEDPGGFLPPEEGGPSWEKPSNMTWSQIRDNLKITANQVENKDAIAKGFRIDLDKGLIQGNNFALKGESLAGSTKYALSILSGYTKETPAIQIKNNDTEKFSVGWDGGLKCSNLVYIGTVPYTGQYAININNVFRIDYNGNKV